MNDKQTALDACDGAHKDHIAKSASAYFDAFLAAEGQTDADALRTQAGERFKAGLRVYQAAHDSSRALVGQVFP